MIHYLRHTEIDKKKWDECISNSSEAVIYACSWWLDIVCPGWDALVLDDYTAVMPLTRRKKFGFSYLFQPAFTQQCGIFSNKECSTEEFLKVIPKQFRLIEIQLNYKNTIKDNNGFQLSEKLTHHLTLKKDITDIRKNYSENIRRNIKKFEKADCTIDHSKTFDALIALFRSNRGREVSTLKEKDYVILKRLLNTALEKGCITIKKARNAKDELIAGAVFIHSFSSYIFLFSAVNDKGRESGAMSAILDDFIYRHAGENKILDFEGSIIPDLARFYKSFGSEEIVYLQIRRNTLPPIIRRLK